MSNYYAHYDSPIAHNSADADLRLRLTIALAARQRAAWRVVQVKAQNGVVRLEGALPSFYDRQLILAVAQHVAGVLRVEDELTIVEPDVRNYEPVRESFKDPTEKSYESVPSNHGGSEVKQSPPPNAFHHLPVLDESLEDILAIRAQTAGAAG